MSQHSQPSSLVQGVFDGTAVRNVYTLPGIHRQVFVPQDQTYFDMHLVCKQGMDNIDNQCVCSTSSNSTPYNTRTEAMSNLFVPENPKFIPSINPALKSLMRDRAPLHLPSKYHKTMGPCQ